MNRVEGLDATEQTLSLQAGVVLQTAQEHAAENGWVLGIDLGARGSCQIGGNIATNAGGHDVVQYGTTRDQVLGLEVVLADGQVLDMMRPMIKNNTGYDLKQWFIGSEGTLGVITRAILRLHPQPACRRTAFAALPSFAASTDLLQWARKRFGGRVAAFELMWDDFFEWALAVRGSPRPFARRHPFYVLIDVVGNDAGTLNEELEELLSEAMERALVDDVVVPQSETQSRQLWLLRESTAEIPTHMSAISFDISLPLRQMEAFAQTCVDQLTRRWPGHASLRFGHLGDGNLHLTVDANSIDRQYPEPVHALVEALIYHLIAEAGGSVSAEHGIGLHKKAYLFASRSEAEIATMRSVKQALDPLSILNPGKVFEPFPFHPSTPPTTRTSP
jgi:FAD/FMN-containing dehydrogenase